jgi:hypothetical protein
MNLQHEVTVTLHRFVSDVVGIAQCAAIATLQAAVGTQLASRQVSAARPPGARLPKRTREELRALSERIVAFVAENPGLRIEQINAGLGTQTRELALPIRRLLAGGVLRSEGHVRATKYMLAG